MTMNDTKKTRPINSREDFIHFVYELSKSFQEDPESWGNRDIRSFLEALAAWVEDMDGYYLNQGLPVPERPDWRNVADMLLAARIYE